MFLGVHACASLIPPWTSRRRDSDRSRFSLGLLYHCHIDSRRLVGIKDTSNMPTSAFQDGPHLSRRNNQIIEPGRASMAITYSNTELAWHSASLPIKTTILPVLWGRRSSVRIQCFGNDSSLGVGHSVEAFEQPACPTRVGKQTEIGAEHNQSIELTEFAG